MRQRSALLQLQMVLALTLALVLVLTLAPSGMISKKGVPEFCPSTVLLAKIKVEAILVCSRIREEIDLLAEENDVGGKINVGGRK